MDYSADAPRVGDPSSGAQSAETLRRDRDRTDDARRMTPRTLGPDALQRLAEFAARLLATTTAEPDDVVRLRSLLRRAGLHVEHAGGAALTLVVPAP